MKFSRSFLAASLLLAPALPLHASVDSNLTMEVKCHTQQKFSTSGPNEYGSVRTVRLDAKQLLTLVAKQISKKIPSGAQLKIATDGKVYVTDSKGTVLHDVSPYFKATLNEKQRLFNGSANTATGKENSKNYIPLTLTLKLPGLNGTLKGIAVENFKVTSPNSDGVQITTGNTIAEVNGKGQADGKTALFDGSLYLKGREATVAP
ncbi:MAG: hypothetical protein EOP88_05210 [Verrucomicrobiaceae bacterium]|nr:MAG: hypothetical protein EOP88_05210 [Verrucomicrobiaceae bacterium]